MSLTNAEASDLFRQAPTQYIPIGTSGCEVAYRRIGTGSDVLFVHGWPVSGATFRTLLPFLADHFTCHIVDLPGAGSSRYTDTSALSFDLQIEAVRKTIEWLGVERLSVIGHDAGGLLARHAIVGDSRIHALALIDTELVHHMSLKFRSFVMLRHAPFFGSVFGWIAGAPKVRRNRLAIGDAFLDRTLLDGEFDEFFLKPLHNSKSMQQAAARILKSYESRLIDELPGIHKKLTMPVHLIWGKQDRFFPVKWTEDMRQSFPNATLTVIDNAGLFAHEEQPEQVAQALLHALSRH